MVRRLRQVVLRNPIVSAPEQSPCVKFVAIKSQLSFSSASCPSNVSSVKSRKTSRYDAGLIRVVHTLICLSTDRLALPIFCSDGSPGSVRSLSCLIIRGHQLRCYPCKACYYSTQGSCPRKAAAWWTIINCFGCCISVSVYYLRCISIYLSAFIISIWIDWLNERIHLCSRPVQQYMCYITYAGAKAIRMVFPHCPWIR